MQFIPLLFFLRFIIIHEKRNYCTMITSWYNYSKELDNDKEKDDYKIEF